jgi:hypothetical protein
MADVNLYLVNGGLRIVSEVSDFVVNEFSTKRNNLNKNELSIVGDINNKYSEYKIDFNKVDDVIFNGVTYTSASDLQDALANISASVSLNVNGKNTGTLFGDDIRTTRRVPVASGKYGQGLPLHAINYDIVGSGYWRIVDDGGQLNGASEFGTGTDSNGKIYVSSKGLNRYQAGQLSYFLFTAAWKAISSTNGNFTALVGASLPGLEVDGQDGDIKEGFMFGWVREDGDTEPKPVMRVYKRFTYTQYDCVSTIEAASNLSIFQLEIGYLGIHPSMIYRVNFSTLSQDLVKKIIFEDDVTSVDDPNLAISVYIENSGNTTDISIRNGSFQYGNYAERPSPDPSARSINDNFTSASISSGTTILACYTLSDKITMYKELNSSGIGSALTDVFRNTISNKLKKIIASAESASNKSIQFKIYLVPKADVVATFTPLNQYINVLERAIGAAITSVSLTNATVIAGFGDIRGGDLDDVRLEEYLLTPELVGVISVSSTGNIENLDYTILTDDLF